MMKGKARLRHTKKAILIVGESYTDKAFLQFIKELYIPREADFFVKVESGWGGSPENVVGEAIRLRANVAYDECHVLVDADRSFNPSRELISQIEKEPQIHILRSTPCLEGLFLAILKHPNFSQKGAASAFCKRTFSAYIPDDQKTEKRAYERCFTRRLLDSSRTIVPELDAIFKAMHL